MQRFFFGEALMFDLVQYHQQSVLSQQEQEQEQDGAVGGWRGGFCGS